MLCPRQKFGAIALGVMIIVSPLACLSHALKVLPTDPNQMVAAARRDDPERQVTNCKWQQVAVRPNSASASTYDQNWSFSARVHMSGCAGSCPGINYLSPINTPFTALVTTAP